VSLPSLENELKSLPVGGTRVILGVAVTRWAEGVWETGTLGRKTADLVGALDALRGPDLTT
jgi:hypothetical protein